MSRAGATRSAESYSPQRPTALVLSGTGTAGAYHAGVLRALHEAGVKLDLVAGHGVGAVGALFAAVDGAGKLWDERGFWRSPAVSRLYAWRPAVLVALWAAVASIGVVALPIAVVALGLIVFPIDFVLKMVGLGGSGGLTALYLDLVDHAFAPSALPTWLPRLVLLVLGIAAIVVAFVARPGWRWSTGSLAARLIPAPLASAPMIDHCWTVLWDLLRGAAPRKQPARIDLGRRYVEFLRENLGQPGFRELVLVAHDIDAGRDLVFALVREPRRPGLVRRRLTSEADARHAEVQDLSGVGRDHLTDAIAGALTVPIGTEPHTIQFAAESYWRGEAHRLCDRPGSVERLLQEVTALGAEQIVLVAAAPDSRGPHNLSPARLDVRGRLGEYLQSAEAAVVRDVSARREDDVRIFPIRPTHNPVGPFDFNGGFDHRSNRSQSLPELMMRGYEDAYHQFIEPVLGAGGDQVGRPAAHGAS